VLINSRGQSIHETVSIVLEHLIPSYNSTLSSHSAKTDDIKE
jgi:hypothetical protein